MDYISNDMKGLLLDVDLKHFQMKHVEIIAYNMLCATNFLHSTNIMHRDIKPANLLINAQSQITICDFGQSRTCLNTDGKSVSYAKNGGESEKDTANSTNMKEESKTSKGTTTKRRLSNHITSRWYRSPEIILT